MATVPCLRLQAPQQLLQMSRSESLSAAPICLLAERDQHRPPACSQPPWQPLVSLPLLRTRRHGLLAVRRLLPLVLVL